MARHLTLEGKAAHNHRVLTIIIIIISCFLLSAGGVLAITYHENMINENRCSQGSSTPIEAVNKLLTAVKTNNWDEACKYTDSDAETTRRIMASTSRDYSKPLLGKSDVNGWSVVTYKSTGNKDLETRLWCKQMPDGKWVVSLTGD